MSVTKSNQQLSRFLLFLPTSLWIITFFVFPYLILGYVSLKPSSESSAWLPGFTLDNYIYTLTDVFFWKIFAITLFEGAVTCLVCLILSYPVAYRLARNKKSKWNSLLYILVISPLLVGVVIRCYGWMVILADKGLINDFLLRIGIIDAPLPLMYNTFGVMVALIQVYLPYMIISLTGSIQRINPELEYTARSLGASRWTAFKKITLPMSLPGVMSGTVLVFVLAVSSYSIPLLLGGNKALTTPLMIVQTTLEAFDWPGGSAMAIIMFMVVTAILSLYIRYLSTAMKGLK